MDINETETETETGNIPYADPSGLLRGLKFALPVALLMWAVIIGAIWLIVAAI